MKLLFEWFWHGEDVGKRLGFAIGTAGIYASTTQPPEGDWGMYRWLGGLLGVIFAGSLSKSSNGGSAPAPTPAPTPSQP